MITVAVSGINAIDNPGPGTSVARCLKESGLEIRIIGLAYDAFEPGIYMDWLIDKAYAMPYPSSDISLYLQRLLYVVKNEKVDIVIPVLDVEMPIYLSIIRELEKTGVKMMLPSRSAFLQRGKERLSELAEKIGFKIPKTRIITDHYDALKVCRDIGFPCMVKGPFYEAQKVQSDAEVNVAVNDIAGRWGFPIIIQEVISGDEYNCAGLGNGTDVNGAVAVKKVSTTKLGKAWSLVSVNNYQILEYARRFVEEANWNGAFELELILEKNSNKFYCIEINPRFPAWIYMSCACGVNLPARMVEYLMKLPFDNKSDYQAGKLMIRYTSEIIRNIGDIEKFTLNAEN